MLSANGIPEKEQEQNPQMMYNIMETYKNNFADQGEAVWHKFDHAKPSDSPQSSNGSIGAAIAPGSATSPHSQTPTPVMISPPASPRFPQNHEGSFENPRAPPPIPTNVPPAQTSPKAPGPHSSWVSPRPDLKPVRAPPPPPVSNQMPLRPAPSAAHRPLPPDPATQMPALERSHTNSKKMAAKPSPIQSPEQYQHEQEKVMAAAQQALANKRLGPNQNPPGPEATPKPNTEPAGPPSQPQPPLAMPNALSNPAAAGLAPKGLDISRQEAQRRKREEDRQKAKEQSARTIAELKEICNPMDPATIYHHFDKIGQGASGGVFKAYEVGTRRCVAIKQMNLAQQPKQDLIINEIRVMKENKHKNIVNFNDSFLHDGDLWVVMEYMEGGSLTDVVSFNIMSEGQIAVVCREVRERPFRSNLGLTEPRPFSGFNSSTPRT